MELHSSTETKEEMLEQLKKEVYEKFDLKLAYNKQNYELMSCCNVNVQVQRFKSNKNQCSYNFRGNCLNRSEGKALPCRMLVK